MRTFRILTRTALMAGLCLSPLAGGEGTPTTPPSHEGGADHSTGPRVHACETDQDRDELREQIKKLNEKDRGEFLERLRHFMEERRERMEYLCECIKNHPHLSADRKQELLAIINEHREEIRTRMKEFCEEHAERADLHHDQIALRKINDRIDDLREYIKIDPCLNDDQRERLKGRLADLRDDRAELHQDVAADRADLHEEHIARTGGTDNGGGTGGSSAVSDEQKEALKAKMQAMRTAREAAHESQAGTPASGSDGTVTKPCVCETDKDRDDLRAKVKSLPEKDRAELITKIRKELDERDQRLDHLSDCIQNHPGLDEGHKKALLAIVGEHREEIRNRMKEFCEDHDGKPNHPAGKIELRRLSDQIPELREFIRNHPCLNDDQKTRLQAKLGDLKDDRKELVGDRKDLHQDRVVGNDDAIKQDHKEIHADVVDAKQDAGRPGLSDEQKEKIRTKMADARENRPANAGTGDGADRPALSDEQKEKIRARVADARENRAADGPGDRPAGGWFDRQQNERGAGAGPRGDGSKTDGPGAGSGPGALRERGNNGVGNGVDPQPRGNPRPNDDAGTGPGHPGNRGGN